MLKISLKKKLNSEKSYIINYPPGIYKLNVMGTIKIRKIVIRMFDSFSLIVFKRYNEINKLTV